MSAPTLSIGSPGLGRFAGVALAASLLFLALDLTRFAVEPQWLGDPWRALLAALLTVPLHLWHLRFGLRGEHPPSGRLTLALLAVLHGVAVFVVGWGWFLQFASLAMSVLVVLRGRVALAAAGLVVAAPILLTSAPLFLVPSTPPYTGPYFALAVAWRAALQYIPVRLLAELRRLDLAQRELELRAVAQARARMDAEVQGSLGGTLRRIVRGGERARSAVAAGRAEGAVAELGGLVDDARRAMGDARRLVAGLSTPSLRARLDVAVTLMEATGATVRLEVAPEVSLDSADPRALAGLRSAVERALADPPAPEYLVRVARDADGAPCFAVEPLVAAPSHGES